MLQTTLITKVRSMLNEPISSVWTDADLIAWAEEGMKTLCNRVGIVTSQNSPAYPTVLMNPVLKNVSKVLWINNGVPSVLYNPRFIIDGSNIIFYPPLYTGYVTIYGTKAPTDFYNYEIEPGYEGALCAYVCSYATQKEELIAESTQWYNIFNLERQKREQDYFDTVNREMPLSQQKRYISTTSK